MSKAEVMVYLSLSKAPDVLTTGLWAALGTRQGELLPEPRGERADDAGRPGRAPRGCGLREKGSIMEAEESSLLRPASLAALQWHRKVSPIDLPLPPAAGTHHASPPPSEPSRAVVLPGPPLVLSHSSFRPRTLSTPGIVVLPAPPPMLPVHIWLNLPACSEDRFRPAGLWSV